MKRSQERRLCVEVLESRFAPSGYSWGGAPLEAPPAFPRSIAFDPPGMSIPSGRTSTPAGTNAAPISGECVPSTGTPCATGN